MSTLVVSDLRSLSNRHNRVRMALAERPLLRSETGDLAADDASPEGYDRRKRPVEQQHQIHVHDQRRLHPNSLETTTGQGVGEAEKHTDNQTDAYGECVFEGNFEVFLSHNYSTKAFQCVWNMIRKY